jgi:hypothetical protein
MADFELAFREGLRQIGAEALRIFLNSLQRTPESEMACAWVGRYTINACAQRSRQRCLEKWSTAGHIMQGVPVEKVWLRWTRAMVWKRGRSVPAWPS